VKVRQGRRRKHLLYDLEVTGGYWKLKEKALDRTMWRNRLRKLLTIFQFISHKNTKHFHYNEQILTTVERNNCSC
jgi:hypothetical protein